MTTNGDLPREAGECRAAEGMPHVNMVSWRKSTYSNGNGGSCVQVADAARVVLVRNTKDRDGRTLAFSAKAWRMFAEQLKRRLVLGRLPASTGHPCFGCPRHVRPLTTAAAATSLGSCCLLARTGAETISWPARWRGPGGDGPPSHGVAAALPGPSLVVWSTVPRKSPDQVPR
jgi:hypothetical protein